MPMRPPFQQHWLAKKNGHVGVIMNDTLYSTLDTGTPWPDQNNTGSIPTIAKNATDNHRQQANETYGKVHQIFENDATMDETLNHQIIETIEDTYIP